MHSLSITNTCDGQTCKIKNKIKSNKKRSQLHSYEPLYNAASCKWNGGATTMQRATIKHMERYTNITVTKIMLVSVICLVLHKRCQNTFWFQQCCSFWWGSQVTEYSSNWLPDTSFPSIILHFEHMKHDPHENNCLRQSTCRSCFFIQEIYTVQSDALQKESLTEHPNVFHPLTVSLFSPFLLTTDKKK